MNPAEKKKKLEDTKVVKAEPGIKQPDNPPETFIVTPRLCLMPFPSPNLVESLQSYFTRQFNNKFMIWNISEYPHPTESLTSQTLDFIFVGYPSPPLSVIFSIFSSIQCWLKSDPENIAIMHCQTTKGRSYMMMASFLVWTNEYNSVMDAFRKLCSITQQRIDLLPSQVRYMKYVQELTKNQIKSRKIRISKIILDGIPLIEQEGASVRPYLQIFQNSELVYTSYKKDTPLISYYPSDISIVFELDLEIEGDVIIRCRHLGNDNKPITILRAMIHTAFYNELIIRLHKSDLDGPFNDDRFSGTFNMDLVLASNSESEDDSLEQIVGFNHSKHNSIPFVDLIGSEEVKNDEKISAKTKCEDFDDLFK
ncbi:hypothetical protein SteCoe_4172 [Stentor coeruleus]|uniref:Phosphatidylinositol-3,4,5-trisphosphate 3-phosphatase n=1 Tax=Stentor coeruleus TaxID=5963 RepID=A0A1R2CVC7_9CILI|nr:hypothetical protein SteCoe_4172 [Stentor coeruleus]